MGVWPDCIVTPQNGYKKHFRHPLSLPKDLYQFELRNWGCLYDFKCKQIMDQHIFKRVLLIERNFSHANIVTLALEGFCQEIVHRESVESALSDSNTESPNLIVVDIQLGESGGTDIIKQLYQEWPLIPIIVLTDSVQLQEALAAIKLGVREVVVKAFDGPFHEVLILSLTRISTALKNEAKHLKLQMDLEAMRIAIENSKDGLAVTDSCGSLVYTSPAFKDFMKRCGSDSLKLWEIFSDTVESADKLKKSIEDKYHDLEVGAVWHSEVKFAGEKNLTFDLSISAIRAGGEYTSGTEKLSNECVVWIHDISETKRREKLQREILSTTTHDLKNPLAAIMSCADLVSGIIKDNERASQLVLRIESSAHTAVNLIDELLSARRIKEGSFILHPADHDVTAIIQEVVTSFETVALARSIGLTYDYEDPTQHWLVDRSGLQRALGNLLSNALKFTPRGGSISVRSSIRSGFLQISVSDTGPGLAPFELSQLFERFTRLDKHADVPGTGIGLFVVKSILSAHGGRVEVTSSLGKGTTFELIFPQAPPKNEHGELIVLDFG
jgi:signal transduction histidine kinase/ActR/RegA family two-component response regulator